MPQNHTNEFSKQAKSYTKHNFIQKRVAKELINAISSSPKNILDLGCGSGTVYDAVNWEIENFIGVDQAVNMCDLHPLGKGIKLINEDFESLKFKQLPKINMTIASSSLQWAKNLESLLKKINSKSDEIAFAIFCKGTFKTIYDITNLNSFLPNADELLVMLDKYFTFEHQIKEYKLEFNDNLSKFRYIKNSGVSGGERRLNFKDTKKLIRDYPLDYLEFEVLFVWGKSLKKSYTK